MKEEEPFPCGRRTSGEMVSPPFSPGFRGQKSLTAKRHQSLMVLHSMEVERPEHWWNPVDGAFPRPIERNVGANPHG